MGEWLVWSSVVVVVIGLGIIAVGMRGQGGGRIRVRGQMIQFTSWQLREIAGLFTEAEDILITGIASGRLPQTPDNMQRAATAWEEAAIRWLRNHPEAAAAKGWRE